VTLRLDPSAAQECAWRYQDVPFSGLCSGRQRHRSRRGSPPGPRAPAAPFPQHPRAELGEPLTRPHLREEEQGRLPPSPRGSWVSARRGHRLAGWFPPDSCPAVVAGRSSWRVRTRVATPPARGGAPGGAHTAAGASRAATESAATAVPSRPGRAPSPTGTANRRTRGGAKGRDGTAGPR